MPRKLKGSAIQDSSVTQTQLAQAVNDKANNAYNQANSAYTQANSAYTAANTASASGGSGGFSKSFLLGGI